MADKKNSDPKRILIVEDESHIADGLRLNLNLQGYETKIAEDGVAALKTWKEWCPNLIVLDIMLPGIDGLSILRNIRLENQKIPILILSAKTSTTDRIAGFRHGVDDYLTKPFDLEEFLLRVDRLIYRVDMYQNKPSPTDDPPENIGKLFRFGNNVIDFSAAKATCEAGTILLTKQEIKLLKLFITNPGTPLSRQKILEVGWGYTKNMTTRTVDNFLVRFRKYFEKNPKEPVYFKSRRSVGYIFTPENTQDQKNK